jgi:hypothetical protein
MREAPRAKRLERASTTGECSQVRGLNAVKPASSTSESSVVKTVKDNDISIVYGCMCVCVCECVLCVLVCVCVCVCVC